MRTQGPWSHQSLPVMHDRSILKRVDRAVRVSPSVSRTGESGHGPRRAGVQRHGAPRGLSSEALGVTRKWRAAVNCGGINGKV